VLYLDASAIEKLVVPEAESDELRSWLGDRTDLVSSSLVGVEVVRAARRTLSAVAPDARTSEGDRLIHQSELALSRVATITPDRAVLDLAARLEPPTLRTLDAIHLATALTLEGLEGVVTYDARLSEAARKVGLAVYSPGA
jgi:predicted nucleic acid-binding protein